jgi:2-polyprenyl-3-methyl-5-hydroxy-6-metoxy-1,4-benzoquinol methylase
MNMDLSHSYAITESANEGHIRTVAQPQCILCECKGQPIYSGQKDCLFGAGGSWDFKICPNRECGLIWLDPMPLAEDIGKAYTNYYTHASRSAGGRKGPLKKMYELMKLGYVANKYNYQVGSQSFTLKSLGWFIYLFPLRRRGLDGDIRFLRALPQGRLLDVGCGSGDWLALMHGLGWQVAGVDFDDNAVKVARGRGLDVSCGALEQQNLTSDSFDAVALSHVIEHVPDPIQTLAECLRILKPGGTLVLFTPNASSLGHRIFKQHWRGLEPPRHLHLFSTQSIRALLGLAGFKNISIRPHIAASVIYESVLLRRGWTGTLGVRRRSWPVGVFTRLLNLVELCMLKWKPSVADCVAAIGVKE